MDIGILVVWISVAVYLVIVLKAGKINKSELKWVCFLVFLVFCCSVLILLNISLNQVLSILDQTFGALTRTVVKT